LTLGAETDEQRMVMAGVTGLRSGSHGSQAAAA